jgi:ketosteroid isomerase-like protein
MASASVDLVRSIFTAWERGDYGSTAWARPQIEFVIADGISPGRWTGLAEMSAAFRSDVLSYFRDTRAEADEYRALDDQRVLVVFRRSARGKTSGLEIGEIRSRGAVLFQARAGKVDRLTFYWDCDRALADLGLAPEGDGANAR